MPIGEVTLENKPLSVVVLASGNGSNAENIMEFASENAGLLRVRGVITDNPKAGVIERCKKYEVACVVIPFERKLENTLKADKRSHENLVIAKIKQLEGEWVLLAGYMRILHSHFLRAFEDVELGAFRVINIHPSLLPSFPGKDAYQQAFKAGIKMSGITLHFVDDGVDTGPPILQECFPRFDDDSIDDFVERGLRMEYLLYRQGLTYLCQGRLSLQPVVGSTRKIVHINKGIINGSHTA